MHCNDIKRPDEINAEEYNAHVGIHVGKETEYHSLKRDSYQQLGIWCLNGISQACNRARTKKM